MTYHFTSPSFEGFIVFRFGADGLVYFSAENATLAANQLLYIIGQMPHTSEWMTKDFQKGNGTLTLIPDAPPAFTVFWAAYAKGNTAFCGAKAKAEKAWNALGAADKVNAIKFIPKYLRHKADTNQNVAYAVTYLNQKTWD